MGEDLSARDRLIEASIFLFSEKGYASTSVREIVAHAGVTKPVLYYYFKNKEGIYRALLDWAAEKQDAILAEVMEGSGTILDRILDLYREIYFAVLENRNLFKLLHNLIFGPPQGAPDYDLEQFHRKMVKAIKEIYMDGPSVNRSKEKEAEDAAIIVLSLMDFCFHMEYVYPDASDPKRPERLLRLAFRGLSNGSSIPGSEKRP